MGQDGQNWLIHDGFGSVWDGTGWYLVELGQYNLVLLELSGTGLIWGFNGYILKKVEIWSSVTIAGRTMKDSQELLDHGRLR